MFHCEHRLQYRREDCIEKKYNLEPLSKQALKEMDRKGKVVHAHD